MINIILKITISVLLLCFGITANSQPYLFDNDELLKLETSKLYVIMDTKSGKDDKYIEIFKKIWYYCPYQIIETSDVFELIEPHVFFMNINNTKFENLITQRYKFLQGYELLIWTVPDNYEKSKNKFIL